MTVSCCIQPHQYVPPSAISRTPGLVGLSSITCTQRTKPSWLIRSPVASPCRKKNNLKVCKNYIFDELKRNLSKTLYLGINGRRASLFCGLRRFTRCNVPNGYHANARSNLYLPFHLTLSFRDFRDRTAEQQPSNRAMFLVVTAQPVHSAYKGSMVLGLRRGSTDERTR